VRRTAERCFKIAAAPVPRRTDQPWCGVEHLTRRIEVAVCRLDKPLYMIGRERTRAEWDDGRLLRRCRAGSRQRGEGAAEHPDDQTTAVEYEHWIHLLKTGDRQNGFPTHTRQRSEAVEA
jgi:hypothetical protein